MATLSANSGNNTTVNCGLFLVYFKDMEYKGFASRLKALQEESGAPKAQYKFAEWLGLSKSFVSEMLRGEKLPSMDLAISLSNRFDVNLDWLMRGKGQKHPNTEPTNHNGYLESANLTPEQFQAVKLIIAQFEQTNPAKAEHKALTSPAENVGGGEVKQPEPTQQAQAQHNRVQPAISLDNYSQEICVICE